LVRKNQIFLFIFYTVFRDKIGFIGGIKETWGAGREIFTNKVKSPVGSFSHITRAAHCPVGFQFLVLIIYWVFSENFTSYSYLYLLHKVKLTVATKIVFTLANYKHILYSLPIRLTSICFTFIFWTCKFSLKHIL
jgi:hypothetical protein